MKLLKSSYRRMRPQIDKRLSEFRSNNKDEKKIFSELCFCIFTANANAIKCDEAVRALEKDGCHMRGCARSIRSRIKGRVRFHNKKAGFLVLARKRFPEISVMLKDTDVPALRDWLVGNIKGYGYKEASHFLRNIGLGRDIAILDRHILKNLKKYGVISRIPDSVGSRKVYMDIESKMRRFSKSAGIPLDALDLLFWSLQTGFIFK
jgi:N-glycosylase/DNA lyase